MNEAMHLGPHASGSGGLLMGCQVVALAKSQGAHESGRRDPVLRTVNTILVAAKWLAY